MILGVTGEVPLRDLSHGSSGRVLEESFVELGDGVEHGQLRIAADANTLWLMLALSLI